MGLKAKWTCTCDNCGKTAETELTPEQAENSSTSYFDPWGPGWPEGWTQSHEDEKYMFFCSHECVKADLIKRGKPEEAEEFENAVWMG